MMFGDYGRDLLKTGIIEAKAGHKESARRYLDRAVYMSRDHDVMAEAWYWMALVVDDPQEKRTAIENCLAHDLQHARARRMLAILDGKLREDEVIDPDHLPPAPEGLRAADADRFMCPKCGGRMSFAPDGQSLVCDYCTRHQAMGVTSKPAVEKDFVTAMATARGHGRPLNEQVFHCEGCGSEFILPPKQISANCIYCGSPHVVDWENTGDLLAPDGLMPHQFGQRQAAKYLFNWVEGNNIQPGKRVEMPRGLYLPLWTFDIGGEIEYTGEVYENDEDGNVITLMGSSNQRRVKKRVSDSYPVLVDDLPIPASRKLSAVFLRLIPTFELTAVKPYDPRFLADWPAEVYDIPLAEASLDARGQAYAKLKEELPYKLAPVRIVGSSSARMAIESFKLVLLPVWMTELPFDGRAHLVLINGQNGIVASDLPDKKQKMGGLMEWLGGLLDE
ncbi:MAG: hypothetical protein C3F07_11030 [Anaerolineales bacterium]|nr:MAG: hypothetical protein C3F07_11030 [Anaerolineales bacterium]